MLDGEAPMRMRAQLDPRLWRWLVAFARATRRDTFEAGTREMLALAEHCRGVLESMMDRDDLSFAYRRNGKLVAFRSEADLSAAADLVAYQARHGAKQAVLDGPACLALEPALKDVADARAGGVHTPDEAVGDAHRFCLELRRSLTRNAAVSFALGTTVTGFETANARVKAVTTTRGPLEADHYVVANGIDAVDTLASVGVDLPVYPLKGYSLTVPVGLGHAPPSVSVTDAENKVVYATLDDVEGGRRLRVAGVAGMVDLVGFSTEVTDRRVGLLEKQARVTFPSGGDWSGTERWAGLRPATPDWKPILGPSGLENLWLATGLGGLGFTLSCGVGQMVAAMISGRETAITSAPYALGRSRSAGRR